MFLALQNLILLLKKMLLQLHIYRGPYLLARIAQTSEGNKMYQKSMSIPFCITPIDTYKPLRRFQEHKQVSQQEDEPKCFMNKSPRGFKRLYTKCQGQDLQVNHLSMHSATADSFLLLISGCLSSWIQLLELRKRSAGANLQFLLGPSVIVGCISTHCSFAAPFCLLLQTYCGLFTFFLPAFTGCLAELIYTQG